MNLKDFCEKDADFRPAIANPVNFDGHAYATDGKILVRVAADPAYQEYDALFHRKWPIQAKEWLDEKIPSAKLSPLPDFQESDLDLSALSAEEIAQDWVPVRFGELAVNLHYLKKLRALPGLKIDLSGSGAVQIPFTFDGGEGLLMSMKLPKEGA